MPGSIRQLCLQLPYVISIQMRRENSGTIFSRFPTVRRFATDLSPKPLPFPKFPSIARSSCSRYWRHEAAVDGWRWRTVTETRSLVAIHSPWRAVRCPARWRRIRSSFVKNLPTMCWRTIVEAEMSARSTPHPGERFCALADRCLVSGSEESRLNDAGAGLVDED